MTRRFHTHYTRDEAQALLPQIRQWLAGCQQLRRALEQCQTRLDGLMADGADLGGDVVNQWIRRWAELNATLEEFRRREIQIKDLDRGLIDFPALLGGREVFLCWEDGEDDIEFWHDLDSDYAGREKL